MPRLPNFLIHLSAFVRPHLLRPDIRVPHIGYVDFKALRKEGFNAVVVDKDNCITLPDRDTVYEPFKSAWEDLLQTFPPGRVLVVSNSAGTPKDPSGIAAESVSLNLQAPVLIRKTPKPGCSPEIISYFRGNLGNPTTLRGRLHDQIRHIQDIEKSDERVLLQKWVKEVEEAPLFGPVVRPHRRNSSSTQDERGSLERRMVAEQVSSKPSSPSPPLTPSTAPPPGPTPESPSEENVPRPQEELRILVVGDRLFTDTLLAHRLSRHLGSSSSADRKVLSIHTTLLPQPNDVRFLRWLETKLSRGRIRSGKTDWGRYIRDPYAGVPRLSDIEAVPSLTWRDKWEDFKGDVKESRLRWDPRTWTLFDLAVGGGRGVVWVERGLLRGLRRLWDLTVKQIKSVRQKRQSVTPPPEPTGTIVESPTKSALTPPVDSVNA